MEARNGGLMENFIGVDNVIGVERPKEFVPNSAGG